MKLLDIKKIAIVMMALAVSIGGAMINEASAAASCTGSVAMGSGNVSNTGGGPTCVAVTSGEVDANTYSITVGGNYSSLSSGFSTGSSYTGITLNNSGVIGIGASGSADGDAVLINSGGGISVLNNSGSIGGGGEGIDVYGSLGALTNTSTGVIGSAAVATIPYASAYAGILVRSGGAITSIDNAGSILSGSSGAIANQGGGIGHITNESTGTIGSVSASYGVYNSSGGLITTLTNNGGIRGTTGVQNNSGTITTLANGGTIGGASYGIYNSNNGTITTLTNSGNIAGSGVSSYGIYNSATITTLTNSGSILGGGSMGIYNTGTITTLTNSGSIASNTYGIYSPATIVTLANGQGGSTPLRYAGHLPTNYNIIINSPTSYGQLAVTSGTGNTTFGIYTGSTVAAGTYLDVLQGFTNLSAVTGTTGTYSSLTYSLVADTRVGYSNDWNLVFTGSSATNISGTGTIYQSSNLGTSVNPVFDGGTLQVSGAGTIANNFTVNANNGVIDQNGSASIFSGVISDAVSGTPGSMTITNTSNNGGSVTFTGNNTYTGSTTINSGATLALAGTGSIAQSSGVANNGSFDISNTTSGATVKAISGTGATNLGAQTLTVSNATGNLSGVVGGTGGLNITGGTQTLSGNNTFSGGVQVQSGASLIIPAASALGSGTLALVGSNLIPATLGITGTTTIANAITVAGDPVFNITSGTTTTVASPITDGGVAGDVVVAGGGTLNLTAANTYTGLTAIGTGSTLALTGNGSIAQSRAVTNNGTFNVSGKTGNVSVASYNQGSTGSLVMGFAPTNNQRVNVAGAASLSGSLSLVASGGTYSAGKYTLLTANGVSGTFGAFSSNLSNYTNLAYSLGYDANDVYLNLFSNGPSTVNTQASLQNSAQALQSTYTLQNSVLANSFSYDCNEFGVNNICISAGGRNTAVSAANGLNNTSALLIAAYRVLPSIRVGAYADQNLSMNNGGSTVNLGNNTPVIGLFGAWNERLDGTGTEVKVTAAYGQKNATVTRGVVGTGSTASEAGTGSSQLNSQGAQLTAKYGFAVLPEVIVAPYAGIRYTQNNMGGYTEGSSSTVTAPLTYSALNTNATTALAGVGASYKFIPKAGVFGSVGVETDTNTANGTYSATGVTGLTPINFNANPVKTRPTATLGAYYDVEKNQRVGINGIYRQEPYQGVSTTTVMATYTIGL